MCWKETPLTIPNDFSENRGMNVIFLTMFNMHGVESRGIYSDLMRKFRDCGHKVYIVAPCERRTGEQTNQQEVDGVHVLRVRTLNLQKTNVIEKGVGQLLVESQFKRAIKKYFGNVKFDLILYSTPPITFPKVIEYLKKKNPAAKSYLLLKDIFPQNAVDMGMLQGMQVQGSKFKVESWIGFGKYQLYKMFRRKEKRLYALSDYIGCMSPANVQYVIEHNPEVDPKKVEVAPNSISLTPNPSPQGEGNLGIRKKYGLPVDKPIFIYGGNLGKPQGIPFLVECLEANVHRDDCLFVVVGSGTEFHYLESWIAQMKEMAQMEQMEQKPFNVHLMEGLPKEDYDQLVRACDVGLIFLDHRFTIPNYPSRLLSYLENKMPVICATDPNTDIGRIAEENGYGFWCESVRPEDFTALVDRMLTADRKEMGERGYEFLRKNYTVVNTYNAVMRHFCG